MRSDSTSSAEGSSGAGGGGNSDYDLPEYYMSVGSSGNRSQPNDYVSSLLY